jgi:REP element-mobilizing transposase RayT
MQHLVARTRHRRPLFTHDMDALALWDAVTAAFPDLIGLCVMPDHVHLLVAADDAVRRLGAVMSGHARRLGNGSLWEPAPKPVPVPDASHARRTLRYILLNPCRSGRTNDPLAWPWSTHRDRVGLAVPRFGPIEAHPERFHRYVSGDPTCAALGTPWPAPASSARCVEEVFEAVCAVSRCTESDLEHRGPARTLALRSVAKLLPDEYPAAARALGVSMSQARRVRSGATETALYAERSVEAVRRAVGDPRLRALIDRP